MAKYSEEFKYSIMMKMMPPHNQSISVISRETGLSEATLHQWRKKARAKGMAVPGGEQEVERWSTQDKFLIVVETSLLSEVELAEYCRGKGLYVEQIHSWRDACMQANGGVALEATRLQKDIREKDREIKKLEYELRRKDAALAETAALLVLRKKVLANLGGRRGRLISASNRETAITLIEEATQAGAREEIICHEMGISLRTLQRWRDDRTPLEDQRPLAVHPTPRNKLSEERSSTNYNDHESTRISEPSSQSNRSYSSRSRGLPGIRILILPCLKKT